MKQNSPDISFSIKQNSASDVQSLLLILQQQMSDDKIENISTYAVHNSLTSYVVIGSGTSSKHIAASAEKLANKMEEVFGESLDISMEGNNKNAQWILIDFQDIIVHLFTHEMREYYNLDELYQKRK